MSHHCGTLDILKYNTPLCSFRINMIKWAITMEHLTYWTITHHCVVFRIKWAITVEHLTYWTITHHCVVFGIKWAITVEHLTYWTFPTCSITYNKKNNLSPGLRKPTFWVSYQVQHKPAVQPQKMARGFRNFRFRKYKYCSIQVAKTKALISFVVTTKLICVFVFA